MARVRKNVWKPTPGDTTLLWYGRAVAAMKLRPIADPLSWRYQAAIHRYVKIEDPLAASTDVLPSSGDRKQFWTQCQHGTWYFLPWHRMYLHHFEKIVAAHVVKLKGPKDWALPYWNYSEDQKSRLLPEAFRNPKLSDGTDNPLFVARRDANCNAGKQFLDDEDVNIKACLQEDDFNSPEFGGSSSFAGPKTKFEHSGETVGSLERTPHGSIHGAVGGEFENGEVGWMGAFTSAALDPIFWLHHANIDRLWDVWLKRNAAHKNPKTNDWLKSVPFKFHDAAGKIVTMTPQQVLESAAAPLSYSYDDVSDPLAGVGPHAALKFAPKKSLMPKKQEPEMVGATQTGIELGSTATHASLAVPGAKLRRAVASTPKTRAAAQPAATRRTYLNIENLTSSGRPSAYDVYINVPENADPSTQQDRFAGRLPMFGVAEASQAGPTHSGSGLHYVLEVTDLLSRLAGEPGWDPENLRVSFVPARKGSKSQVHVGRISLYMK